MSRFESQGKAFERLIRLTSLACGVLNLRYSEPEDCMEVEFLELSVVPENRVYIKRCYDLEYAFEEIAKSGKIQYYADQIETR